MKRAPLAVLLVVVLLSAPVFGQGASINVDDVEPVAPRLVSAQFSAQLVDVEDNPPSSNLVLVVKTDSTTDVTIYRKVGDSKLHQVNWRILVNWRNLEATEQITLDVFNSPFSSKFLVLREGGELTYTISSE